MNIENRESRIEYPASSIEHRPKSGRWFLSAIALLGALAFPRAAGAQELVARAYANTPIGLNFIGIGYGYSAGNVFFDPALPLEDTDARINAVFVRYVRSLELFGKPAKVKATLPWTTGHWEGILDGEHRTRDATGLADARVGFDILLSGAPPLEPADFATFQQRTIVGLSFDVVMPTGKYDPTKVVNISSNRWAFNPELAVSQSLGRGWIVEAMASAWFFTVNDDFVDGLTLEQDNLFALKVGAIHTIRPGFYWAFGLGFGRGGTTRVEGVVRQTLQRNWRFGAFLSYPVAANQGVMVSLMSGVTRRVGADFDSIAVAYQFSWGGR